MKKKKELSNKEFFKKLLENEQKDAVRVAKILNNLPPIKHLDRRPVNKEIYNATLPSTCSH